MQENEMLKLFQGIREIFPESFLQLLDKNNHIIQETPDRSITRMNRFPTAGSKKLYH